MSPAASSIAFYPAPVSKVAMWRDLAAAAEVPARSFGYVFALPFAADSDRAAAETLLAARLDRLTLAGEPSPDAAQRAKLLQSISRTHHRARRLATAALRRGTTHFAIWNGGGGRRRTMVAAARAAGLAGLFAELAPIAGHITLDPRGVNADSALPRDAAFYAAWGAAHPSRDAVTSWRDGLQARAGVQRPDQGQGAGQGPFVFAPLQVRGDTQIARNGGWIGSVPQFIAAAAEAARALPPGWRVVFREHPSCRLGNAEQLARLVGDRVVVDNTTDTFELVRRAEAVVTVNSSVGLQSLLFGTPVCALGAANYAIPGIVRTAAGAADLVAAFEAVRDWPGRTALSDAFLAFLATEYFVRWPVGEADRPRLAQQVRTRLAGRLTDWTPPAELIGLRQ